MIWNDFANWNYKICFPYLPPKTLLHLILAKIMAVGMVGIHMQSLAAVKGCFCAWRVYGIFSWEAGSTSYYNLTQLLFGELSIFRCLRILQRKLQELPSLLSTPRTFFCGLVKFHAAMQQCGQGHGPTLLVLCRRAVQRPARWASFQCW